MLQYLPEWGLAGAVVAVLTLLIRNNATERRDARLSAEATEKRFQSETRRTDEIRNRQVDSLLKRVTSLESRVDRLEAELRKERKNLALAEKELIRLRDFN